MKFEIEKRSFDRSDGEIAEFAGMATYGELCRAAQQHLRELKLAEKLEHLSALEDDRVEISRFQRLACYATPCRGGGHDLFVDAIDEMGNRHPLLTGRTFLGFFIACEIAGELARFFYQDNS
jgi:hypothetical protein